MAPATQHQLIVRRDAAQAVVDAHRNQPFAWGVRDCGRSIVAPILRAMGHKCPLAPFGKYSTELGALKALKRNGYASMEDFLDKRPLLEIPPAAALIADLVGLETPGFAWLCIGAVLGNGRVFAFMRPAEGLEPLGLVVQPERRFIKRAWRVPVAPKA